MNQPTAGEARDRQERYAAAIHDAMEADLSLADQEPAYQALFARAAEAAMRLADAERSSQALSTLAALGIATHRLDQIRDAARLHRQQLLSTRELYAVIEADEPVSSAGQAPATNHTTLRAALDGLHTLIATSSRDWGTYRVDAWIWAVLCGWDCEETEHDDTCTHGALEEMAALHGWDADTVAKARRYRAAVRAITEGAAVLPAPVDQAADAPAAECSAQNRNYESGPRLCIRAAQHRGDHIDERGFHWSDTVAVYPVGDGTFRRGTEVRAELRRLVDETPDTQPPTETCAHCGKTIRRVTGTLAAWWVHDPGGNTVCDWARAATSHRATPPAETPVQSDHQEQS